MWIKPIWKKVLFVIFVVAMLLLVTGCGNNIKREIIGKWETSDGAGLTVEFFKDGTVVSTRHGSQTVGQYTFIDDNTMRVEVSPYGSLVYEVSLDGDTLTITLDEDETYSYTRVDEP